MPAYDDAPLVSAPPPARRRKTPRPADAPWLSPKEAAAYVGVGIDTIYDACASGDLLSSKLGHSTIRIHRERLDAWMVGKEQAGERDA